MMTLDDAWRWYVSTKQHLSLLGRIGRKHWDSLPWDGSLGKDDKLKSLEGDAIDVESRFCLVHLDDLAILGLFSAFESAVRDHVLSMMEEERNRQHRPLVVQLIDEARHESKRGRVLRLLGFFKSQDAGLVEEVNQVRRYRNWVVHGRRKTRPTTVSPAVAYDRLNRFLDRFIRPPLEE